MTGSRHPLACQVMNISAKVIINLNKVAKKEKENKKLLESSRAPIPKQRSRFGGGHRNLSASYFAAQELATEKGDECDVKTGKKNNKNDVVYWLSLRKTTISGLRWVGWCGLTRCMEQVKWQKPLPHKLSPTLIKETSASWRTVPNMLFDWTLYCFL